MNWIIEIEFFFEKLNTNFRKEVFESNLPRVIYYLDDIYIEFEFQNSNYLDRIEIGKQIGNNRSNYKIIFAKNKPENILLKQNLFEIDSNVDFQINFSNENLNKVNDFLNAVILNGWTEKIFKYNQFEYKNEILIGNKTFTISLKSNAEEDLPYILDPLFRKIEDYWYDINFYSKKKITINNIKPLKKTSPNIVLAKDGRKL